MAISCKGSMLWFELFIVKYTQYTISVIQFVAFLLYHLWICQLWKCILSYRKRNWSNFIAFGLHCLGVVRERKKRYRNLATDFLYRLYSMFWTILDSCFERLIFVLVKVRQDVLSFKWLYCCVNLFDHFISLWKTVKGKTVPLLQTRKTTLCGDKCTNVC